MDWHAGFAVHLNDKEHYHLTVQMISHPSDPRPNPFVQGGGLFKEQLRHCIPAPEPNVMHKELEIYRVTAKASSPPVLTVSKTSRPVRTSQGRYDIYSILSWAWGAEKVLLCMSKSYSSNAFPACKFLPILIIWAPAVRKAVFQNLSMELSKHRALEWTTISSWSTHHSFTNEAGSAVLGMWVLRCYELDWKCYCWGQSLWSLVT